MHSTTNKKFYNYSLSLTIHAYFSRSSCPDESPSQQAPLNGLNLLLLRLLLESDPLRNCLLGPLLLPLQLIGLRVAISLGR